jgi:hypothetical protein
MRFAKDLVLCQALVEKVYVESVRRSTRVGESVAEPGRLCWHFLLPSHLALDTGLSTKPPSPNLVKAPFWTSATQAPSRGPLARV